MSTDALLTHRVTLDQRSKLTISGVEGVESFDESAIVMSTAGGALRIQGGDLHIEKLSLDGGDLLVQGRVDALIYEDPAEKREGFFSRILRL